MLLKFVRWDWDTNPLLTGIRFYYHFEVEPTAQQLIIEVNSKKMSNADSGAAGGDKDKQQEDLQRFELSQKIFTAVESVIMQNGIRITSQDIITLHDGENFVCSDVATDYEGYTHVLA
ncbi:hypothetical protein [Runella sp.]|uniref:hypothetical protein n=1 Tax=Runella sp. TaxID=1960881 RepID=UPI003D135C6C